MSILITLTVFLILTYFLIFIKPDSYFKIVLFNSLLGFLFYRLSKKLINKKYAFLLSFVFFIIILIRSLKILDAFNFIILFLFLLSVFFLIK
jgi:hypothetical protein